jgi:hypothetical protein
MIASGTIVRTSTRPAARAPAETGGIGLLLRGAVAALPGTGDRLRPAELLAVPD